MAGVLLDSHALYWLVSGEEALSEAALYAIGESQAAGALFVSPITAWELALAARKPTHRDPPRLGDGTPEQWFRDAVRAVEAIIVPIRQRIALEAATVAMATAHGDPGDCFLIATARVRRIPIVTRDGKMRELAGRGHLHIVEC